MSSVPTWAMRAPASPRRHAVVVAAVVAVAAAGACLLTARLGVWQLERARHKLDWQAARLARAALPPLDAATLAREAGTADAQHQRRVRLQGRWVGEAVIALDNRQMHGRPGFVVLTPLRLADGSAVLVQRGWTARDAIERSRLAWPATPIEHDVVVEGRVQPPPSALLDFGDAGHGALRQNVDTAALGREFGLALRPLSVQQTLPASAPGDGLLRDWPGDAVDVSRHHGYAFQWFGFSVLIAGLYVWHQFLRPARERR